MLPPNFDALFRQYQQSLLECQTLYLTAAQKCLRDCPHAIPEPAEFPQVMDDLHRGLLVKLYVSVAEADLRWTEPEQLYARGLFQHVWQRELDGEDLREAVLEVSSHAVSLTWFSLVRPFERMPPLRECVGELETLITRIGNLVAKADGTVTPSEANILRVIQQEMDQIFHPIRLDQPPLHHAEPPGPSQRQGQQLDWTSENVEASVERKEARSVSEGSTQARRASEGPKPTRSASEGRVSPDNKTPEERLKEAIAELESLIGLANIKEEVRTLTNFLQMQRERKLHGLPPTNVSLHLVFRGNPGTGKTTVARIVGRIYAAMGLLTQGHLVETDRSGLVAEFAGQTSPKTHRKIDEALHGILFIDEAYSLVAQAKEDPYGQECVQVIVKRMEDDRERLAVIAAGYSEPLDELLESNPGLSSRFGTQFTFPDYSPGELGRIFQTFCDKNHYVVPARTQAKLLLGFQYLHDERDKHFGNGRLARNVFERAIRRLANRISGIAPLTKELLTVFEPEDIEIEDVPASVFDRLDDESLRFEVTCPGCKNESKIRMDLLGRRVQCKKCSQAFVAAWGEPVGEE